ncbi:uncharacterized protein MELLADRAFT_33405, partial [Melampsora larici-populina 98AG31]
KALGLYGMEYGNGFIGSICVSLNRSHAIETLKAGMEFKGPSIVLSYLPEIDHQEENRNEVMVKWPLYRWIPWTEVSDESFVVEDQEVHENLNEFFSRRSHLSLLSSNLSLHSILQQDMHQNQNQNQNQNRNQDQDQRGLEVKEKNQKEDEIKEAYERLVNGFKQEQDERMVRVLFGSDTGTSEKLAKKLTKKLIKYGLKNTRVKMMNEFVDEIESGSEEFKKLNYLIVFCSTTGQGEIPLNGRKFWKLLGNGDGNGSFEDLNYMVFGLGDSHYWPKKEDIRFYNKASKDIDMKLESLGAKKSLKIGLGDEQDPNGILTGYRVWEKEVWKVLGIQEDGDEVEDEVEDEPITNEHIKLASEFLRGTIREGLMDTSTGALAESDGQVTKFHGIYQQDDRDVREARSLEGLEPAYSFMVRCRLPAGVCTPQQWLMVDELSRTKGNDTFKLTTRQTFQFHGVVKKNLKGLIQGINQSLMDTLAACGDVNRTVMCSANPTEAHIHQEVYKLAEKISEHLLPKTTAYGEIWLDKKLVGSAGVFEDEEPLYGPSYLPRKFKISIAIPPENDVDVFAHDVGLITIIENHQIIGYNLCVGGGMGVTHSNQLTYPRLSNIIGFLKPDEVIEVIEKILLVQRDFGNRNDRKQARMKYTIDRIGIEKFIDEIEIRLGRKLNYVTKEFEFESNVDKFGWCKNEIGEEHFTMFIENGRVEDKIEVEDGNGKGNGKAKGKLMKTGLREIAKVHKGTFRLTPNQHLMICNISSKEKPKIEKLLKFYGLNNLDYSGLRLSSSACVAFPTCGLAMAESERYLPILIDKIEKIMEENGLRNDELVMRMTGCPNGCARPWVAEVAFVGKSKGNYLMLLGGNRKGTRLNKPFKESVNEEEILKLMSLMILEYSKFRLNPMEGFGDFSLRVGWIKETTRE